MVETYAAERRKRWGCGTDDPNARYGKYADLQAFALRAMGLAPGSCPGCPWEGVYAPRDDGWLGEVFNGMALAGGERLPTDDEMGRPVTAADRGAVLEVLRARAHFRRVEQQERDKKRREDGDD